MSWATADDVLTRTGAIIDGAQLSSAVSIVEVFAGVTEDTEDLTDRNLRLLNRAVCFQAAWMVSQVDVLSRTVVDSLDQDGARVTPAGRNALLLAPLADRCLAQLSWRRPGSVRVCAGEAGRRFTPAEAQAAYLRDQLPGVWRPL